MALTSRPATAGTPMGLADWELIGQAQTLDGVTPRQGSNFMRPSLLSGRTMRIATGFATVGGFEAKITSTTDLTSTANSSPSYDRIDTAVLRRGADGQITAAILPGSPAASPVGATPTQLEIGVGAGIWEMILATWVVPRANGATISGLVDARQFWPPRFTTGLYQGPTDGLGLVTFNHGLGITPRSVQLTGADSATRFFARFVFVTADDTQIQVAVYREDSLSESYLTSSPVAFSWTAYA